MIRWADGRACVTSSRPRGPPRPKLSQQSANWSINNQNNFDFSRHFLKTFNFIRDVLNPGQNHSGSTDPLASKKRRKGIKTKEVLDWTLKVDSLEVALNLICLSKMFRNPQPIELTRPEGPRKRSVFKTFLVSGSKMIRKVNKQKNWRKSTTLLAPLYYPDTLVNPDTYNVWALSMWLLGKC